jgi:cation diffusion facilitator CzcD-associated flavoprotein CzcO
MGKAQWILPRSDRNYGTLARFLMTLPVIRSINRLIIFGVHESRFAGFRNYRFTKKITQVIKLLYARNLKNNLEKYIADDALRQHMMPDYELDCRRVIPTNKYLPALARDNGDVDIDGIEKIRATGIRTKAGKDIPLDVIVYATGFYAYSDMKRAFSFQVYGRDGRNLNSEWEIEAVSHKGIMVSGYPNYFKVNGPNTGTGHSSQISYMEAMVDYTLKAICAIKNDKSIKAIDV